MKTLITVFLTLMVVLFGISYYFDQVTFYEKDLNEKYIENSKTTKLAILMYETHRELSEKRGFNHDYSEILGNLQDLQEIENQSLNDYKLIKGQREHNRKYALAGGVVCFVFSGIFALILILKRQEKKFL